MLHKLDVGQFKEGLRRYFKGSDSLGGQPLPEVNKALIEDAPRVVRLTIWGVILFFVFLIVWASVAPIDEVTRGEGKAIPSSKVQKIQNLEGHSRRDLRQGRADCRSGPAIAAPGRNPIRLQRG